MTENYILKAKVMKCIFLVSLTCQTNKEFVYFFVSLIKNSYFFYSSKNFILDPFSALIFWRIYTKTILLTTSSNQGQRPSLHLQMWRKYFAVSTQSDFIIFQYFKNVDWKECKIFHQSHLWFDADMLHSSTTNNLYNGQIITRKNNITGKMCKS